MYFLTFEERIKLHGILTDRTLLGVADAITVINLLKNSELLSVCRGFNAHVVPAVRVSNLCAILSDVYVTVGTSQLLGLVAFLKYLSPIDPYLSDDDRDFIEHVVAKWERSRDSDVQKRRSQISYMLAQARQAQPQPVPASQRVKIDRGIIVYFNLEALISEFHQRLGYEGAFAFAVGGPSTLLEHYVIERILLELRNKTQRPYKRIDLRLYRDDISAGARAIEDKLVVSQNCGQLCDLFADDSSVDILLIVWNYDVPKREMSLVAASFWDRASAQILPLLQDKGCCFVAIWANVGGDPLDKFIVLPVPSRFDVPSLKQWFRGRLKQLGLEDDVINHYINRLESQHGHLIGTYHEMDQIVRELQGGVIYV